MSCRRFATTSSSLSTTTWMRKRMMSSTAFGSSFASSFEQHQPSSSAEVSSFREFHNGNDNNSDNNSAETTTITATTTTSFCPSFQDTMSMFSSSSSSFDAKLMPTGSGGSYRVMNNTTLGSNPFQASCVEMKFPSNGDRSCKKKKTNYSALRASKQQHQQSCTESNLYCCTLSSDSKDEHATEPSFVFYFETSTEEGLQTYQRTATMVKSGMLSGQCENETAVAGFGTWTVPQSQYLRWQQEQQEGQREGGDDCKPLLLLGY